ncbi:ABC transporter ATP-binding protein [Flavobacterium psychrophilum]|uniref:ABC transporter ATP-binding protein n=1 Tax=Flavobacterium psychrophilum TaxID=96345 RepID=UPI000B7C241D|nr:ABC transporter ATP-binding protein [Flavobacterium psychrophilum]EKT4525812.1 ABC transporter ATP-binding protein [Flavobacterium psychrophilum]MBF2025004.1 ABC transporter ATP-binding protein [Flavobacterium psychrophilum]MCB5993752.1 ABC transporter ATP-binding protein [Flavobacterium psychrophilum]MCB5996191.1 ABC transporter ATP-binding protein [Flavobacterium psychrophilum]MCB6003431.1 ABC transporter ATP-binding protein [Flavobacterium psychrophilum]
MSKTIIKAEDISKQYRLGLVGTGTLKDDIKRWWHNIRGKEDPFLKIGQANNRATKGESDYVWSLQDINFEINQGDSVGIIGRNGAGKSTLLKILSQVTQPTTGKIYTKGRIASLLEVGTGFHPELTGRENIFLNGAILGMRKHEIARKLDEIIAFSGVERYIDTPVKRYSSGMYVRLAFAVAAHLESEILIIDEVLAVGDADFQKKCLGKMNQVSKGEGRTVLFVSHNMAAVEALCNTAITLKNGHLIDSGNPSKLIKNYLIENSNTNRKIRFSNIEEAIGNNAIKILSASVNNASSNNTDDIIDLSSDIEITFELLNLTNNPEISIGFDLKTTRGEILFGSGRVISCPNHKNTTVTCQIPGNLLNDDTYQILLYVHTKAMGLLFMKDEILSFEIKDAKREEGYLGKVNGFIRPTLTWK